MEQKFGTTNSAAECRFLRGALRLFRHAISSQLPVIVAGVLCCVALTDLHGQVRYPARLIWSDYDPYLAVVTRVTAQADLIQAQGYAAVRFAEAEVLHANARVTHAEGYSRELDNWMKLTRTRWNVAAENRLGRMNRDATSQVERMKYLNDGKWANSRQWERLRNHPELKPSAIHRGMALNFLLARLSVHALPYRFDEKDTRYTERALRELKIDPDWLSRIMLQHSGTDFPADRFNNEQIVSWPYLLRWQEFDSVRAGFETARTAVVSDAENNGTATVVSTKKLQQALAELAAGFHGSTSVRKWVNDHHRYSQFSIADRFLRDLDLEVRRLEKTGDIRPFQGRDGFVPSIDGNHLISLLSFMNRHGIRFAPAQAGDEFVYHNLFVMMRALYLTEEEADPSTQPENLRTVAEEQRKK